MASVQTNLNASFVLRQMGIHNTLLTKSLQRLSSGYRINTNADDPSGLSLADKFRTQIRGLQQASRNISLATNFIRAAEDGMTSIVNLLQDIRDLALEAANGTVSTSDRTKNQTEINELLAEIDRLATGVRFNGIKLLNGTFASRAPTGALFGGGTFIGSAIFQVGAYQSQTIKTFISTSSAKALGVSGLSVTTQLAASNAVTLLNSSITHLLSRRARTGGFERRLSSATNIVDLQIETHLEAESAIRDADIAAEVVNFTKQQILLQASTAMLAQANIQPQSLLLLFKF